MQKNNDVKINSKVFYRSVAALVIPMALQNLINVGVQSTDVIMLGRLSQNALSAGSLAGQVQFIMMMLFFGLASGASVIAAQYWGKGDTRTIEKVLGITLRLAGAVSVIFFCVAMFLPEQIMRIFSPNEAIIAEGVVYLRLVAPSYLFMAFSNTYLNVMRSVERVMVSAVIYFISLVANIFFNWIFIFGELGMPKMGIGGAALGTSIARFIELIIVIIYASQNKLVRLRKKDFVSLDKVLFKDFRKYSLPTTLNEIFWGVAISMNSVIIGHVSDAAVAANSVAQTVRQLATVVCFGLANAAAITIGKTIGGGEKRKAELYAGRFVRLTFITGVLGSIIIFCIKPFIVNALTQTPEAAQYLNFLLTFMCVYVIAQAYNTTMVVGIFRGGGDTRFGTVMDFITMWCICLPIAALAAFVFKWPVEVIFICLLADEFIKFPITTLRYRSKLWLRDVTR